MAMDPPNKVYPPPAQSITSTPSPMPLYLPDPSIKGVSFDQLLSQRGIRFIHQKAVPCPNIQSVNTNAHVPDCPFCDDSGIIYYDPKEIWGVFSGNSIEKTFEAHGIWEVGSAVVTLPTQYPDGTQADFNTYDRLTIPDFEVRMWELKEYEPRDDNVQQLRYPIHKIDYASSINGTEQKFYLIDVDFTITPEGHIQWIDGQQPPYDPTKDVGEVIVWSYYADPVYVVLQSLRELRITQEYVDGQKVARRLPQQILVRRDFMMGNAEPLGKAGT